MRERERGEFVRGRERWEFERGDRETNQAHQKVREVDRSWPDRGEDAQLRVGASIFVGCLPPAIDIFGLKGIFRRTGCIDRVVICRQQSRRFGRFSFIRYTNVTDAERSVCMWNNKNIRGMRIVVQRARNKEKTHQQTGRMHRDWDQNRSGHDKFHMNGPKVSHPGLGKIQSAKMLEERGKTLNLLQGKINEDMQQWLELSLVGETMGTADVVDLKCKFQDILGEEPIIITLSRNKVIIVMKSSEQADQVLQQELLKPWVINLSKWSKYEVTENRWAWLEVIGIPPLGWGEDNFNNIAACWGTLERLEYNINDIHSIKSFQSMKMLISTRVMNTIEDEFILSLQDTHHRVFIREISSGSLLGKGASWGGNNVPISRQKLYVEKKSSSNNDDIEEISRVEGTPDEMLDISQGDPRGNQKTTTPDSKYTAPPTFLVGGKEEGGKSNPRVNETFIATEAEKAAAVQCGKPSSYSNNNTVSTKTKTAFHLTSPPTEFMGCSNVNEVTSMCKIASEAEHETTDSISVPPGFEEVTSVQNYRKTPEGKRKRKRAIHHPKKMKLSKHSRKIQKGGRANKVAGLVSSSNDSIYDLAKEAVDLGNRLGLKIVSNEKGAIKRIANSIKKQRKEAGN